jgi:hypothetical protein
MFNFAQVDRIKPAQSPARAPQPFEWDRLTRHPGARAAVDVNGYTVAALSITRFKTKSRPTRQGQRLLIFRKG